MDYYNSYNQGYVQDYSSLPSPSSSFSLASYSPQAIILAQVKCMAIGIVVFLICTWLISKIPVVGPWVSDKIKLLITKTAEWAGVLKCGFANDFDSVLEAEKIQ